MSSSYFLKYKTVGGYDAFFNPEYISHIYPKAGWTVVVMRNGHEFVFDSSLEDFFKRIQADIADATRSLI